MLEGRQIRCAGSPAAYTGRQKSTRPHHRARAGPPLFSKINEVVTTNYQRPVAPAPKRTAAAGPRPQPERGKKKPASSHARPRRRIHAQDYTWASVPPKSGPPISYTIEDEVKPDGVAAAHAGMAGVVDGISFDKVTSGKPTASRRRRPCPASSARLPRSLTLALSGLLN